MEANFRELPGDQYSAKINAKGTKIVIKDRSGHRYVWEKWDISPLSHKKVDQISMDILNRIQREAFEFDEKTPFVEIKKKIDGSLEQLDQLYLLSKRLGGKEAKAFIKEKIDSVKQNIFKQYGFLKEEVYREKIDTREKGLATQTPQRGLLVADFKKHLNITTQQGFNSPLTPAEEAFINQHLKDAPALAKVNAQYEMLREKVDHLAEAPPGSEVEVLVGDKTYKCYDLDGEDYVLIGSAGKGSETVRDYFGYLEGEWPFTCTSLIDGEHPFFNEPHCIFQILSIPPAAIAHTSPKDLRSPFTGLPETPGWYGMHQRAQVLTNHINTAFIRFQQMQGKGTSMSTEIDQLLRMQKLSEEWGKLLYAKKETASQGDQGKIDAALALFQDPSQRVDRNKIKQLIEQLPLAKKDLHEMKEILNSLRRIEKKYPEGFSGGNFAVNRVFLQLAVLTDYYKHLKTEERKEAFQQLFQVEDPTERYDILGELKELKTLLNNIPDLVTPGFASHLNRMMGPQEILSETPFRTHNELNIDATRAGRMQVKGWLLSKAIFQLKLKNPVDFKALFEFAEKNHIPIFIRSDPAS